jgi:hypothetical protein
MMTRTLGIVVPLACLLAVGVLKQAGMIDAGIADTIVSFLIGGGAGLAVGGAFINTPPTE